MISVEALHKHYGKIRALDGLEMNVGQGAVFGFLGPNGAGKTTTLRILTGLARPTSGTARVAGVDLAKDGRKLAKQFGYLPEEPAFYPWMTPIEFLELLGRLHGLDSRQRLQRAKELLKLVDLEEAAKRRIGGFSRGMRQRLGLAAALVHRPKVLLLDEPVSALDPAGRKQVLDLIEKLGGECTVLMSSHILADVERVCNEVGIINRGRMVVQGKRERLMDQYANPVFLCEGHDQAALQSWAKVLEKEAWVTAVKADGMELRVTVSDVPRARIELLASVVQHGIVLRRYEEARPTLEDVFLQLVGKEVAG